MVIVQVAVDISLAAKDATREIKALMLTNERKMGKGREDFATVYDSPPPQSQAPAIRHTGDAVVEDDGGGGGGGGGATFIFRVRFALMKHPY